MHRGKFDEDYEFGVNCVDYGEDNKGYQVFLPHQCDDWEIVGANYKPCPTKELAVKQMKLFIQRAQEALQKLESLN